MKQLLIISFITLLISCKEASNSNTNSTLNETPNIELIDSIPMATDEEILDAYQSPGLDSINNDDHAFLIETYLENALKIDLMDFQFILPDTEIWDSINLNSKENNLSFYASLGLNINEKEFLILSKAPIKNLTITESYKSYATISDEGPHLDLVNWKEYQSKADTLKINQDSIYTSIVIPYPELDSLFPSYTMEELINVVNKVGGKRWVRCIEEPPFGTWEDFVHIAIGSVTYEITYILNGKEKRKSLTIRIPMGC